MLINGSAINSAAINASSASSAVANAITGSAFTSDALIVGEASKDPVVLGGSFTTVFGIFGGAEARGASFKTTPTLQASADFTAYVTGSSFNTTLATVVAPASTAFVLGRGFGYAPEIYSGATIIGKGFNQSPTITSTASDSAAVTGATFRTQAVISAVNIVSATVTGRGFSSSLFYSTVIGSSITTKPTITLAYDTVYAEAVVMNMLTNAVTRYQNTPFMHMARLGGKYYGFTEEGLYELSGTQDESLPVNGTIHGKAHDFDVFNSKNVPYLYLDGDDTYRITAFVDGAQQSTFTSGFSGRRVKLARGNKGRYWSFKLEGINKLQGIEFMPDSLSRRVK